MTEIKKNIAELQLEKQKKKFREKEKTWGKVSNSVTDIYIPSACKIKAPCSRAAAAETFGSNRKKKGGRKRSRSQLKALDYSCYSSSDTRDGVGNDNGMRDSATISAFAWDQTTPSDPENSFSDRAQAEDSEESMHEGT